MSSTEGETSMDHSGDHGTETTRSGMGPGRLAVLVAAVAFLAGAIGWAVGGRQSDPLITKAGRITRAALLLLGKEDVDSDLLQYAQEIVISQRFDQGVFNATLDRFGHRSAPDDTVMGWMGHAMAPDEMPGLATEDQMRQLRQASGEEAAALWIALMSEHHLGGMHMAAEAVDRGQDQTVVNLARGNQTVQADEVLELSRYRLRNGLPIPDGFTDPVEDEMVQARVAQMQGG